ncbi:ferredoxin [Nocardia pseudobrasiliensis]|uniref:Ferredoxin n=1 Tax=Nocardia pseudobrasiliensis TaxID=45979 RepID=A0A370ICP5_9NOCA|nr:ferredoxin [Nocardia pseudobrasiliensis]RDI68380.1 ferredoxin [Nocardia pseudobrasiliensis]
MSEPITVEIDQELCLGSGYCVRSAPTFFHLPDEVSELRTSVGEATSGPVDVAPDLLAAVRSAALVCPAAAIVVHEPNRVAD